MPSTQLHALKQNQQRVIVLNRVLRFFCAAVILVIGLDLVQWSARFSDPVPPVRPSLTQMNQRPALLPELHFSETLFHLERPVPSEQNQGVVKVAPDTQWKITGVSLGATRQALLQDVDGKRSVWVTEGERLDSFQVKEIRVRSVLIEMDGKEYEIRM